MKSNSPYAQRKHIIKPSKQEFAKGFKVAPIRQILSLKLPQFLQLLLLNFFSHDYDNYRLSINGISNSFGYKKNRADVVKGLKKLEKLGYLKITETTYEVDLVKINADYRVNLEDFLDDRDSTKEDDRPAHPSGNLSTISTDSNASTCGSHPIIATDSSPITIADSSDINNKENIKEKDKYQDINKIHKGQYDKLFPTGVLQESFTSTTDQIEKQNENEIIKTGTGSAINNFISRTPVKDNFFLELASRISLHKTTNSIENSDQTRNDLLPPQRWYNLPGNYFNFFKFINSKESYTLYYDSPLYHFLNFQLFEKILVISIIREITNRHGKVPEDNQGFQASSYGKIKIDNFEETLQYCNTNNPEVKLEIEDILNRYRIIR